MDLTDWADLFRLELSKLGMGCSKLYACGFYGLGDRDPAEYARRASIAEVPGVIWYLDDHARGSA